MANPLSRRTFFAGACGIALASIPTLSAEAASAIKKLPNGKLSFRLKDVPALATVGGSTQIGTIKGKPVAVTRTGSSTFVAFTLICPHQGVTVEKNGDTWVCNAHGSQFEANGALVLGPATTGLTKVPVKLSRGQLTVG